MKHNTLGITHGNPKKKSDLCNVLEQVICILNKFTSEAFYSLRFHLLPGYSNGHECEHHKNQRTQKELNTPSSL